MKQDETSGEQRRRIGNQIRILLDALIMGVSLEAFDPKPYRQRFSALLDELQWPTPLRTKRLDEIDAKTDAVDLDTLYLLRIARMAVEISKCAPTCSMRGIKNNTCEGCGCLDRLNAAIKGEA